MKRTLLTLIPLLHAPALAGPPDACRVTGNLVQGKVEGSCRLHEVKPTDVTGFSVPVSLTEPGEEAGTCLARGFVEQVEQGPVCRLEAGELVVRVPAGFHTVVGVVGAVNP